MSPKARHRLTLAALVTGATSVAAALGLLGNGIIEMDRRLDATGHVEARQDTLNAQFSVNDSVLFVEVAQLRRQLGLKARAAPGATVQPVPAEGLVRRVWKLLF